jgi:hypothetical protein
VISRFREEERNLIKTVFRLAGIMALALSVLAVSPLSPASAASMARTSGTHPARPNATACTYGSSSGNVHTCMAWSNSGSIINYIDGTAEVINSARVIEICIHSSVVGTIECNPSGYILVGPGGHIAVDWSPGRPEPSGTYCVRTWRQNSDGTTTMIGDVCVSIS